MCYILCYIRLFIFFFQSLREESYAETWETRFATSHCLRKDQLTEDRDLPLEEINFQLIDN